MAQHEPFLAFRKAHPRFVMYAPSVERGEEQLRIQQHFEIPGLAVFRPELSMPWPKEKRWRERALAISDAVLLELAWHIGLVELISYWKAVCSPEIHLKRAPLQPATEAWLHQLIHHGLGEFFYRQNIQLAKLETELYQLTYAEPSSTLAKTPELAETDFAERHEEESRVLIPVGGGKDSVVTLERLRHLENNTSLAMGLNSSPAVKRCMALAGIPETRQVHLTRSIDPALLELNKRQFLNGHTPFSALLAVISHLVALCYGCAYVALSNEDSANESSVRGTDVNHQWSKSLGFERDFQQYQAAYLPGEVCYFSLLRPFSELAIAREFARYPAYHEAFLSCNLGQSQDAWCGRCGKCLFVAAMLLPFLGRKQVEQILHHKILDDETLLPEWEGLTGQRYLKPWECVGTSAEFNRAIALAVVRWGWQLEPEEAPVLVQAWLRALALGEIPQAPQGTLQELAQICPDPLRYWGTDEAIPARFRGAIQSMLQEGEALFPSLRALPIEMIQAFRGKSVGIVGFGREGKSSLDFILRHWGELQPKKLYIADAKALDEAEIESLIQARLKDKADLLDVQVICGADYLNALAELDLVLKSPGISFKAYTQGVSSKRQLPSWPQAVISGQIDLFLSFSPAQDVVGVTGTKGKTSTATLCAQMLKAVGRDCQLLGNIGVPVLDLWEEIGQDTAVVLELSSHQLEFTHHSPRLAIMTNFFEEHLDHYNGYEDYLASKAHIYNQDLRTSGPEPCLIVDAEARSLVSYLEVHKPEHHRLYLVRDEEAQRYAGLSRALPGRHQIKDAALAAAAARHLGVDEAAIQVALKQFKGIEHRTEILGSFAGIEFINDSIATIPQATMLAIETFEPISFLLVGGMDRGVSLDDFVAFLAQSQIRYILCLPDTGYQIYERLQARGDRRAYRFETLEDACRFVYEKGEVGDRCLLSPAASSYHRWKSFEERGREYRYWVEHLAKTKTT